MRRYKIWEIVVTAASIIVRSSACAIAANLTVPKTPPPCSSDKTFAAADFSFPLTSVRTDKNIAALAQLRKFGVHTIFRYYDLTNETLPGKTLHSAESDAIIAAGLSIGVVFQHHNDDPAKFLDPQAGAEDAARALTLADENLQPHGTAIYFGVDGPEMHLGPLVNEFRLARGQAMSPAREAELRQQGKGYLVNSYNDFLKFGPAAFQTADLGNVRAPMMMPVVQRYFQSIRAAFDRYASAHNGAGFKIGMYCTGSMCSFGHDNKLADFFWLSTEGRNEPSYVNFLNRGQWNLVQQLPTTCTGWEPPPGRPKFQYDLNLVNDKAINFGQWDRKRIR